MSKLKNYAAGQWIEGDGKGKALYHAVSGDEIATATSDGIDIAGMYEYARNKGGEALRRMTFQERGLMLKALALHLYGIRKKYYPISYKTGATKADSWIDIDGGIGTLFAYASLRKKFGDQPYYLEGEHVPLSKQGTFMGHHIMVPRKGVAVHINAFNFPIWGMLEKVSVNLLAGVPAIVKPATVTSFLAEAMVQDIIASGILPEGSLQLICGSARDILDYADSQDVITFTGSASTGKKLKSHPRIIDLAIPFNMEADSLNASILGEDAVPGTPEFELFIKEVRKEVTVKCGQKCTAIRRVIVPEHLLEDVQIQLGKALEKTTIGNPENESVRMGALVGKDQVEEVNARIKELLTGSTLVYGSLDIPEVIGADSGQGAFMSPVVLRNDHPFEQNVTHEVEAFGPVTTIMPYRNMDEAIELANRGKGSLCCSLVTDNPGLARHFVMGAASHHGRILILNAACAAESTGHGSPMPLLVHGGPGRAGGGEEMGGVRGVKHYMQRTALQGHPGMITEVTQVYQPGAPHKEIEVHPFRLHFEDIKPGMTLITARHTVTETDITNFANVSGDHFYAHMDATSLEGTIFEQRVAHGYFILSKAAGLFVDARKGPVLLNYGIDECRFTKPVYPGMTIGVRFTAREKISQEKREESDIAKGIVKWYVDVYDETGDSVAIATILTMVKKKDQST